MAGSTRTYPSTGGWADSKGEHSRGQVTHAQSLLLSHQISDYFSPEEEPKEFPFLATCGISYTGS